MVRGLDVQDALRFAVITKPVTRNTCGDRMRAELENSEEGREHLAREQSRVDAKRQTQASASSNKRPMSEEWDRLPGKALLRVDGEDATLSHDITATSGASSSSGSGGPAMDIDSQPSRKRAADLQTEDLEDGEQTALTEVDANESTLSLPQAEGESSDGRTFIGSWEHDVSEMHNQRWGEKVVGDECLGLGEIMHITTMNEQGVHLGFHK